MYQVYNGSLARADGTHLTLAELRGKPVLLVFWSSWCPDCKEYLQGGVEDAFAAMRSAGGEAYLVCREGRRGETWDTAMAALAEMKGTEQTLMDESSALYAQLGLRSVPSAVLLDEEGRLMVATTRMPGPEEVRAMLDLLAVGHQAQSERFLREHLLSYTGSVVSSYKAAGGQVVCGTDVLSETQGLMMLYAVAAKDKPLFDQLLAYVRNEMNAAGLAAWRISSGVRADVNATLDDLRILEALILAEEAWGGYAQEIAYRESALYRMAVREGILRDQVALATGKPNETVTLCYLDVAAMERLAQRSARWQEPAALARAVLTDGVISEEFPLFYPRYDVKTGAYSGDTLQMNEALVAILHAQKAGIDCTPALNWLEDRMMNGGVLAVYTREGHPVRGAMYESTATYALLAQAAMHAGREELAAKALARMERIRCFTPPMVGDMGDVTDQMHYTFDLVQAMLAWQQWNERN